MEYSQWAGGGLDQAAGSLTVNGDFNLYNLTLTYHGGTIAAPFMLHDTTLDLAAPADSPQTWMIGDNTTLNGDVPPGHTLIIGGQGSGPTLTSAGGFANHGHPRL